MNKQVAGFIIAFLIVVIPVSVFLAQKSTPRSTPASSSSVISGTSYYIDCTNGNDTNTGTSESQAWKTLLKANAATLSPGDVLLLKRGCTWQGPLAAKWKGTQLAPITIDAYGTGELPIIQNDITNVAITGSYQIIQNIHTRADPERVDAGCQNQKVGRKYGFAFLEPADHNTVQNSEATDMTAGVQIHFNTHFNKVLHNKLINNNMMDGLDTIPNNDYGAFGLLVHGDDAEVAYNEISGSDACSYDYGRDGSAIEIYGGRNNYFHHNISINNNTFTELGNSQSTNNTYAYNIVISHIASSSFIVARPEAPQTKIYNNTFYSDVETNNNAGIVCTGGCNANVLIFKNNIVDYFGNSLYADGPFAESNNMYWSPNGQPRIENPNPAVKIDATSKLADPLFMNPLSQDFHLKAGSPAIDAGTRELLLSRDVLDYDNQIVPQGLGVDIGALEFTSGIVPSNTPTQIPTMTLSPTQTQPSPTSSISPTGTLIVDEDIDHDGCIGLLDFNAWFKAIKGTPQANTTPDVNHDGSVDIVDFNLWFIAMKNLTPDKLC